MICDAGTCSECRYLEDDERHDLAGVTEFLANCQHAKCKVVRLVRQQISKLQNMQYERFLDDTDDAHKSQEETYNEIRGTVHKETRHNAVYETQDEVQVQGRVQQAHEKTHETPKAIAVARRIKSSDVTENTVTPLRRTVFPERAVDRKWMLRVLSHVRHRAHLILAAAVVGVIVWSALVYGPCFLSSLKYTRAKRMLF